MRNRHLFTPLTLRGRTVRNRLWVAPMCQYSAEDRDGMPTDWHLVHLGSFAHGGAGAVLTEATAVSPEGRISPQDLGLWNDAQRDALARIVDALHACGASAGVQLAHAGRKASTHRAWDDTRGSVALADGGWETVAPSAIAFPGLAEPRALDADGIRAVVDDFAAAATRAKDAGFDLVEVHAAHGYLLHEFLSPLSNHRTDAYGGSFDNRVRLLLEIVDAVRAAIGDDLILVVRFSATDWTDGGWTIDETVEAVRLVAAHGADLVDISSGGNVADARIPVGPGYQVPFAARIRAETGVPTAAVGMIDSAAQAEQILVTGQADVVLSGREMLRNPHFALRAARDLDADLSATPPQLTRGFA
ncbi:NADH:flavin oxidoreductase/NADH oxidase [Microbacterium aurantiacum]|uniref:NADH:flavin oxidoreductase/NADH oxidase n=1 Tax=Microbacterium aurantiacum TaxID=162393 RepID=A0AAJ2LVJ0_9MICO|nr:NADH:flavin oxidoreductase/NADH oxidase [Microbacterium aurantiacum]MDS0244632.1 NADH:flavin oxidoreductase/NADH oxidase [Microbacterium aurantiacum]